ncbi:nucleolar pre-ribosomal-associated [Brachionus plicatilis]|uniref:Nucleolar pre-ribosomal-associated n=1 Tax=Brachionus plicatilis TaxID=10195 RepID=A0A3M7PYX2_BRAPC|nr:nucleolar pre-ribosomal-associated [Brachionus plicatilis]
MSHEDEIKLVDNDSIIEQLSSLENKLSSLLTKLDQKNEQKFELIDRTDLKNKLNAITTSLVTNNFSIIKKNLQSKSSPGLIPIQQTCVRLLTMCVHHSFDLAKQISSEFNYFNETKNWLEKFLLIKKSELREMSLQFILTYLKYVQPPFNCHDNLILIKKILLKSDSKSPLTLINCIFAHTGSDLVSSLDSLFTQLLYGVVRNQHFSKTDKIRLFSDHILSKISKLFEYEGEDQQHQVSQMVIHFFKCLFTSTKFGISFHDKSLGLKSDKNLNHLIFNQLIALDFNKVYQMANGPDLFTATLRQCPDLTQKFIKVKLKQLASDNLLFVNFLTTFFHQQSKHVRSLQRFLQGNEHEHFLLELIVATSMPLGLNFHKELSEPKLELLTACLNCVKEWKALVESEKEWSDSMRMTMEKSECQDFETKLNLELLSKYLPKFDQLSDNFPLITAYIRIFQQSLNLMDLEQIEMDLSLKLEADQAAGYLEFVQCVTEIKCRNNFEMVSDRLRPVLVRNLGQLMPRPHLMARLVPFFQLVLSSSEMVKFDADLMYLCLRMKMAAGAASAFLETVLCQRKRNIVLLDQAGEVGLDRFLALVDPSDHLMFYSGLLNANVDLDVYADRVSAIKAMVGTKVHIGEEKVRIKSCSQAFMGHLRQLLDLDTADLNVKLFNLSIRSRLLIFLLKQVLEKTVQVLRHNYY